MSTKRGFTLVELLVVIAIIAVLLSILMPALSEAKERARRIVCRTHERSLGVGNSMYATINNGRMVGGDMWNGITIWYPINYLNPPSPYLGEPVNMGHLLGAGYIPLPTSETSVIYCPSNLSPQSYARYRDDRKNIPAANKRDFFHNWNERSSSQMVDNNYLFNDDLDGIGLINFTYGQDKGMQLTDIPSSTPYLSDWYDNDYHKGFNHVLMADGSVQAMDIRSGHGKLIIDHMFNVVYPACNYYPEESWWFMYLNDYFGNKRLVPWDYQQNLGEGTRLPNFYTEPKLW